MLTSKKLLVEIARLEAELAPISKQLDAALEAFGKELVPVVNTWMNREVARKIEDNSEKINSGGMEPLRAIKSDLDALLVKLPTLCHEALGNSSMWPHHQDERDSLQESGYSRPESYFQATFRRAISPIGELLSKHGLLTEKPGYVATWAREGHRFRYALNPGFETKMCKSIETYSTLRSRHEKLTQELANKKKELSKAQARELWNKA